MNKLYILTTIVAFLVIVFSLSIIILYRSEVKNINQYTQPINKNANFNVKSYEIRNRDQPLVKHSLAQESFQHNIVYFNLEDKRNEDLRILRSETKNWNGRVAHREFTGRDEKVFGRETFHLYGSYK